MGRFFILFCLLASGLSLKAQQQNCTYTLSGDIIDRHDQSNLAYATLFVHELNRGVVADSSGAYLLDKLCLGSYTVTVSHVSCDPVTTTVEIDGNTQQTLYLEHHVEALKDLTIVGTGIDTELSSQKNLELSTLERFGSASLGDALKEINGVASLNTGNTLVKPVVQGLYGSRILIVNQGVRLQDMEWGEEHAPNVDINSAGAVRLVTGPSALRYGGDAIGGTIIIEPAPYQADTLYGKVNLQAASNGRGGLLNGEIFKSGKQGWFGKFQGSLKRFGDFRTPDYFLTNTGVFEKGLSFHAGRNEAHSGFDLYYSLYDAEIAILASSHIGNIDDLVQAINSDEPLIAEDFSYNIGLPKQEVTHHLARVKYYQNLDNGTHWHLQYDFQLNQRFEFDVRIGDDRDKPAIDLELTTHTASGNLAFNQKSKLPLEAGIIYRFQDNFADPETGIRRLVPDYNRYEWGAFLIANYQLAPLWTVDAGIRYDFTRIDALKFYQTSRWMERGYDQEFGDLLVEDFGTQLLVNPVLDFHNISASLGARYLWGENGSINLTYALAQRPPNPSELFSDGLHQSASRIELGDLRIGQETSHKLGVTIKNGSDRWTWDVSPFINVINGFIILEPAGVEQTIRGAFPVWEYRQVDATLWGLDASALVNWSQHWSSDHGFAYIYGQDTEGDRPLINMPPAKLRNRLTFTHDPWHHLQVHLESVYNFRQNRYPDNNFDAFLPGAGEFEEVDISTPPEGYHLLNLRLNTRFELKDQQQFEAGLIVENLLNTQYRDYLNRLRFFADETGINLKLSLKYNF